MIIRKRVNELFDLAILFHSIWHNNSYHSFEIYNMTYHEWWKSRRENNITFYVVLNIVSYCSVLFMNADYEQYIENCAIRYDISVSVDVNIKS